MFKVISDIMEHWYDLWNTIVMQLISAKERKWFVYGCLS